MTDYQISLEKVRERHPKELEQLKVQVAGSASKFSDVPVEQWRFYYSSAHAIRMETGAELLKKLGNPELEDRELDEYHKWKQTATIEERVQKHLSETTVNLVARPATRGSRFSQRLDAIPPEVRDDIVEMERHDKAEYDRIAAMTPEEREADTQRILRELRGFGGFGEIHVGGDGQAQALLDGIPLDLKGPSKRRQVPPGGQGKPEEKPKKRDKWSGGAIRV